MNKPSANPFVMKGTKKHIEDTDRFFRDNPLSEEEQLRGSDSRMRDSWTDLIVWEGQYYLRGQLNQEGAIFSYLKISEKLSRRLLDIDDEEVYTEQANRIFYA